MCGIFGFSGKDKPTEVEHMKILMLGMYNMSRGKDSCGYATIGGAKHGINSTSDWDKFIAKEDVLFAEDSSVIICHTRRSSNGGKTLANAHPFKIPIQVFADPIKGKKANKKQKPVSTYTIYGAHNGHIKNWRELCSKEGIPTKDIDVDSKGFFTCVAFGANTDNYSVFEKYEGTGAFIWINDRYPDRLYFFRGESRLTNYTKNLEDERPLYYWTSDTGTYLSSMPEALNAIGAYDEDIIEVPANTVFALEKGEIVKIADTKRAELGVQTFVAARQDEDDEDERNFMQGPYQDSRVFQDMSAESGNRMRKIAESISTRRVDNGEYDRKAILNNLNSIILRDDYKGYTRKALTTIDIHNDVLPQSVMSTGGIKFSEGVFYKTGHIANEKKKKYFICLDNGQLMVNKQSSSGSHSITQKINGVMHTFHAVIFVDGFMLDWKHSAEVDTPLHQQEGIMFPQCDKLQPREYQRFYIRGKLATGTFSYPGSNFKKYTFCEGILLHIINHSTKEIFHREDVIIRGEEKSKLSRKSSVSMWELLSVSKTLPGKFAFVNPMDHAIWYPYYLKDRGMVMMYLIGYLVIDKSYNRLHFSYNTFIEFDAEILDTEERKALLLQHGVEERKTWREFFSWGRELMKNNEYVEALDGLYNSLKPLALQLNFSGFQIPDITTCTATVVKEMRTALGEKIGKDDKSAITVTFPVFMNNYHGGNIDKAQSEAVSEYSRIVPDDVIDYASMRVWRRVTRLKTDVKDVMLDDSGAVRDGNFEYVYRLLGEISVPGTPEAVNSEAVVIVPENGPALELLEGAFIKLMRKTCSSRNYTINEEIFLGIVRKMGYIIDNTSINSAENFCRRIDYAYAKDSKIPFEGSDNEEINSTIGDDEYEYMVTGEVPTIPNLDDFPPDPEEAAKVVEAEKNLNKVINEVHDECMEVVMGAEEVYDQLTEQAVMEFDAAEKIIHIIDSLNEEFGKEDIDDDATEDDERAQSIEREYAIEKGGGAAIRFRPDEKRLLHLNNSETEQIRRILFRTEGFKTDDLIHPDGCIRRFNERFNGYEVVGRWYYRITDPNGEGRKQSFEVEKLPTDSLGAYPLLFTAQMLELTEKWDLDKKDKSEKIEV